jgi:hypothetical protein
MLMLSDVTGLAYRAPSSTMGGGASKSTSKKPIGQAGAAPTSLAVAATKYTRDWNDEFQR